MATYRGAQLDHFDDQLLLRHSIKILIHGDQSAPARSAAHRNRIGYRDPFWCGTWPLASSPDRLLARPDQEGG